MAFSDWPNLLIDGYAPETNAIRSLRSLLSSPISEDSLPRFKKGQNLHLKMERRPGVGEYPSLKLGIRRPRIPD